MPTIITRASEGNRNELVGVFPGQTLHFTTESAPDTIARSFLIACYATDLEVDIFELPDPEAPFDPDDEDEVQAQCCRENHIKTLTDEEEHTIAVTDYEVGPFDLVFKHYFLVSNDGSGN